jgi:hypothetical protein
MSTVDETLRHDPIAAVRLRFAVAWRAFANVALDHIRQDTGGLAVAGLPPSGASMSQILTRMRRTSPPRPQCLAEVISVRHCRSCLLPVNSILRTPKRISAEIPRRRFLSTITDPSGSGAFPLKGSLCEVKRRLKLSARRSLARYGSRVLYEVPTGRPQTTSTTRAV